MQTPKDITMQMINEICMKHCVPMNLVTRGGELHSHDAQMARYEAMVACVRERKLGWYYISKYFNLTRTECYDLLADAWEDHSKELKALCRRQK